MLSIFLGLWNITDNLFIAYRPLISSKNCHISCYIFYAVKNE